MPDPARRNAFVVTVVGLAFCVFFQLTKHTPALARVNPFADDPYDAVSSAAVQFVLFVILLTLLRAFRPAVSQDRLRLQFAAQLMASVAIAFSLLGDLIAMARHVPLWKGSSAGYDLLALTLCLLLWIAGAIVFLFVTNPPDAVVPLRPLGGRFGAIAVPTVLVLLVYPERFRQTLAGAILTALCGMVLLFLVVWAIGTAFAPASPMPDLLDDLAELAASLGEKLRLRPLLVERGSPLPRFLLILLDWLNPEPIAGLLPRSPAFSRERSWSPKSLPGPAPRTATGDSSSSPSISVSKPPASSPATACSPARSTSSAPRRSGVGRVPHSSPVLA